MFVSPKTKTARGPRSTSNGVGDNGSAFGGSAAIDCASFGEIPTAPEGAAFTLLTESNYSDSMLGHSHDVFTDGEGNGFTGPPRGYCCDDAAPGGHQHTVTAGVIQPYADEKVPNHSHSFSTYKTHRAATEAPPTEVTAMSEATAKPENAAPAAPENVVSFAEFEAMKKEREADKARIAALETDREKSQLTAQFSETWEKSIREGRATPGDRERKLALFMAQSSDVVSFGENAKTARELFLEDIATAPAVISFSEKAKPGAPASTGGDPMARVNAKMAENIKAGMNPAEAATAAFSECGIEPITVD